MADPFDPRAWNRTAYVYGNPVNYTDSTGHYVETLLDLADLGLDFAFCMTGDDASCAWLGYDVLALAVPLLPGSYGNQAFRAAGRAEDVGDAARRVDELGDVQQSALINDEIIIFYHGTSTEAITSFEEEGFKAIGSGDFGIGFYTTRRKGEAIQWAGTKAARGQEPYVIAIEIRKSAFDELVSKVGTPGKYSWHGPLETEMLLHPKGHPELPFDYIYGNVSLLPGFEQFTFKSKSAFDLLDSSPRSVYKVSPEGNLKLISRITP